MGRDRIAERTGLSGRGGAATLAVLPLADPDAHMHRRHFLGTAALAATSLMLPLAAGQSAFAAAPRKRLLPVALNPGDTVALVSPSAERPEAASD